MAGNTMRELAVRSNTGDLINELVEENPILATIPFKATNAGVQNVAKKMTDITGAQVVDMDAPLPQVSANGELVYTDVSYVSGEQTVGFDEAKLYGGAGAYFSEYSEEIMTETGNNLEKSFVYNTLKPFAKDNGNKQNAGGTLADKEFSIVAVRYNKSNTGIYSETASGSGLSFEITPMNGGNVYKDGSNIPVYGQMMKTNLGFQFIDSRNVSYIANVDLTPDGTSDTGYKALPTEAQMDEMLLQIRANEGASFIYMHPKVKNALHVYKGEKMQLGVMDENYKRSFDMWEGVKIVTSFNMLTTEAVESFA